MVKYEEINDLYTELYKFIQDKKHGNIPTLTDRGFPTKCELELRPSLIKGAGNGVFTLKDIKKGEYITSYGVYVVSFKSKVKGYEKYMLLNNSKEEELKGLQNYKFEMNSINVFGNPKIYSNNNMGHLINDSVKPTSDPKSRKVYEAVSLKKMNCIIRPIYKDMKLMVFATRDIKAGEELYTHYTYNYWKTRV